MDPTRNERHQAIERIEAERNSKVISYILHPEGASIADDVVPPLYHQLMTMGRTDRLDVILASRGGSPESAWRILTILREFTDHLSVIVGFKAFSAAAFIALGADEIVMSPLSELGPVHIQTASPLAPIGADGNPAWVSPYDIMTYVEYAKTNGANPEMIFGDIDLHPLVLGSAMRAYNLAKMVSTKCLGLSSKARGQGEMDRIVDAFIGGTHSSSMPFTRFDCLEELKLPVTYASPQLEASIGMLVSVYNQSVSYSSEPETDPVSKREYRTITPAILESLGLTQVYKRRIERIVTPEGNVTEVPGWGGWMNETVQEAM